MKWWLLVIVLALAGRLAFDVGRPTPDIPTSRPIETAPPPPPPHLSAPPPEQFAAMVARPLFLPGRRPIGGPAGQGPDPLPQMRLVGIVLSGKVRLALVQSGDAAVRRLAEGQNLDGWIVAAIEPARVVLRRDQIEHALALVKVKR
jgi:hypothetical protein